MRNELYPRKGARQLDEPEPLPGLSISVVTYDPNLEYLRKTLRSVGEAARFAIDEGVIGDVSLLMVDNGPGEGWADTLKEVLREEWDADGVGPVEIHPMKRNLGYGRGHNLGILRSRKRYYLVLNPDVVMDRDAIVQATRFMEGNSGVGVVAPRVRKGAGLNQHLCKRDPNVLDLFLRGFCPAWVQRRFRNRLDRYALMELGTDDSRIGLPVVSGCFLFCRTRILQQAGGFDPRYFLYFEDNDLSRMIRELAPLAYEPKVVIEHFGGGASRKGLAHIRMFCVSAWKYFRKHGWRWM
ncbi:MAG: glycosyltransferase family 2 protein [Planctomycetota bacterium]|jgi:GT2 family glycosyltransferase